VGLGSASLGLLPLIESEPILKKVAHQPELDGVRGIAVLAVMAFHFSGPFGSAFPYEWLMKLVSTGWAGVDLFFVLSGFLITRILLNTRGRQHFFRNFYARRALRILPVYVLVVGGFFWIALPFAHVHGKITQLSLHEQAWYWLFLENWRVGLNYNDGAEIPHLWSVAVEEQFYLMWSLMVAWFGDRHFVRLTTALIFIFLVLRLVLWQIGTAALFIRQNTFTRMDGLMIGALLAASPRMRTLAARYAPIAFPAGCALLLCFSALTPVLFFTNALAFGCLVARASEGGFSVLRWHVLRSFGKYSYAIYMFHYIVISLLARLRDPFQSRWYGLLILITAVSLSYGMAWLSWQFLEQPVLRLKRLFPQESPG
jgi:peptidoglycan/LPS O-acetylase OafA/YrhL